MFMEETMEYSYQGELCNCKTEGKNSSINQNGVIFCEKSESQRSMYSPLSCVRGKVNNKVFIANTHTKQKNQNFGF